MQLNQLATPSKLVYATHQLVQTFQATQKGSAVGTEFEDRLRNQINTKIAGCDLISWRRDMGMGMRLASSSDLSHELDLIVRLGVNLFVFELKHYTQHQITKDMLLVFNQKVLDYHLENFKYTNPLKLYRIFVTCSAYIDPQIRQFCALWGILLIDRELYSPPICDIILGHIYEKRLACSNQNTVLQGQSLQQLQMQAGQLTPKLWRELGSLWSPQASLPGKGFQVGPQLPSAYASRRWVAQHREIAQQTRLFKFQFEKWQRRLQSLGHGQEVVYG